MRLVPADQYYDELLRAISTSERRVVMAAMVVRDDAKIHRILKALMAARQRGVEVHLLFDAFTYLSFVYDQLEGGVSYRKANSRFKQTLKQLEEAGARVSSVGKLSLNPYRGRCHVKITVIDDLVYCFGGVNLADEAFANTDFMLATEDASLADYLDQLTARIVTGPRKGNIEHTLDGQNALLFDAGERRQSVIYNQACAWAERASRIYYVSQMCPSGRLAKLLNKTETICYFTRAGQMPYPDRLAVLADQKHYHIANNYQGEPYIHAKFILFELTNGTKALVTGSNNFSWRGVAYGTQEIALASTDPMLWDQIYQFMQDRVV